jgi:hypothetical protein
MYYATTETETLPIYKATQAQCHWIRLSSNASLSAENGRLKLKALSPIPLSRPRRVRQQRQAQFANVLLREYDVGHGHAGLSDRTTSEITFPRPASRHRRPPLATLAGHKLSCWSCLARTPWTGTATTTTRGAIRFRITERVSVLLQEAVEQVLALPRLRPRDRHVRGAGCTLESVSTRPPDASWCVHLREVGCSHNKPAQ